MSKINSFKSKKKIKVNGKDYVIYSLTEAEKNGLKDISKLPKSLKVLLENLLRYEDNSTVDKIQINAIQNWLNTKTSDTEIAYRPARVLMQDYTGIPAVADLAAMRDAVKAKNKDPKKINPLSQVDLVIDHSVMVDNYANKDSFDLNVEKEFSRNGERYSFLKWGQQAFDNFKVVPPGTGICHQVNLEYLSKVVWSSEMNGELTAYPDTLVGTDSHTGTPAHLHELSAHSSKATSVHTSPSTSRRTSFAMVATAAAAQKGGGGLLSPTSQLTICHPLPGQVEVVTTTCVIMMISNRLASFLLSIKIITSKRKIPSRATRLNRTRSYSHLASELFLRNR